MKIEFYGQIFEKPRKYHISGKSVQREPGCSTWRDSRTYV